MSKDNPQFSHAQVSFYDIDRKWILSYFNAVTQKLLPNFSAVECDDGSIEIFQGKTPYCAWLIPTTRKRKTLRGAIDVPGWAVAWGPDYEIPLMCKDACDNLLRLIFDEELRRIKERM
jgi:hypothetical protein